VYLEQYYYRQSPLCLSLDSKKRYLLKKTGCGKLDDIIMVEEMAICKNRAYTILLSHNDPHRL